MVAPGAVGEPETLVEPASGEVGLVDTYVHRAGATVTREMKRRLHQRPTQSAPPACGDDVQLRQVALQTTAPDRRAETKDGQSGGFFTREQNGGVAAFDQLTYAVRQRRWRGSRLSELNIEVMQETPNVIEILNAGSPGAGS